MKRALILIFLCSAAAQSQPLRFGVKGGVPLGQPTADFGHLKVEADHWTVGPSVEFRLPARLSLEIDALYSSYTVQYSALPAAGGQQSQASGTGNTRAWDFPAAFKFRFRNGAGPFVLGGVNYRRESSDVILACFTFAGQSCALNAYGTSQDRLGPVLGGGFEWKLGRIRLGPEFRYTHLNRPGANQYLLLFGVGF